MSVFLTSWDHVGSFNMLSSGRVSSCRSINMSKLKLTSKNTDTVEVNQSQCPSCQSCMIPLWEWAILLDVTHFIGESSSWVVFLYSCIKFSRNINNVRVLDLSNLLLLHIDVVPEHLHYSFFFTLVQLHLNECNSTVSIILFFFFCFCFLPNSIPISQKISWKLPYLRYQRPLTFLREKYLIQYLLVSI